MVGLTLGTGVGGVIAVDGRVHLGHDGTAGEVGHQTIDPDGPPCGCGNHGCLEAFARADRIAAACGTATAEAAVDAARAGDARALAGLAEIGRYLGIGIANMIDRHLARPGRDRRRDRGGRRPAARARSGPRSRRGSTRRRSTEVEVVTAELGTWAGAIGAAVHGAEAAGRVGEASGRTRSGAAMTEAPISPQYRQIEQALRERIATLRPGERLPSDAELCAEFGVSRMTARNAMQRLAEDGLVARQPGRGSFVAETPAHRRANRLMTFTQEMLRRGRVPSSRMLTRVIRPSTTAEAASLGIPPRQPVVDLRRLRLRGRRADGRRIDRAAAAPAPTP